MKFEKAETKWLLKWWHPNCSIDQLCLTHFGRMRTVACCMPPILFKHGNACMGARLNIHVYIYILYTYLLTCSKYSFVSKIHSHF